MIDDFLDRLNSNQRAAALWDEGPLLVLAGPGSGKTATLTTRVARLVRNSESESFRILCLTFTRKAAAEMRERLLAMCPTSGGRVQLTTFHSFGTDILRQHGSHFGLSPNFEIIEDPERVRAVRDLLAVAPSFYTKILSAEKALAALDHLFQRGIEDADIPKLMHDPDAAAQLRRLFADYKQFLKTENCVDYGAILYFCEELLRTRPRLAKQLRTVYKYVCVDEFQDTNPVQYRLLRALAPERDANLFIVGDDDQVIYQWNGASPSRVNELANHYDLTSIQLPENYRCPPDVVQLANSLIQHNSDRSPGKRPLTPMKPPTTRGNVINVIATSTEEDEARTVAQHIARRLQTGSTPRDIAVLARNSRLLMRVQRALGSVNVKAHIQQRKSQFESGPMRFIVSCLKLAAVRSDEELVSNVTKALSDSIDTEIGTGEVIALASQANGDHLLALSTLATENSGRVPLELCDAIGSLAAGSFEEFLRRGFKYFDDREQKSPDGTEQFTEYPSERQVWRAVINELGGESEAYAMTLSQFLQELTLANKTPEPPSDAVRCLTVHASKGMEFGHVYLVGLAEDQLPSFQAIKAGDTSREMQEERRNCFVAVTRTLQTLTMSYAAKYNGWSKMPSRFLSEMGLDLI
ncbi:ATP-dependent helicase [Paraburkholderia sp. C35]|uniref:ATP-dependent helicase n=1 Tax=Paraburkholderia sp. C35 TaxID=2126993 RepID=UPI000D68B416|nr:ATP-dependent helicase [Paraburkholderia sp. C35]